jgi:hypothetical protein
MTAELGHTDTFWSNNKRLLKEAIRRHLHQDRNFAKAPAYCGIEIKNSIIKRQEFASSDVVTLSHEPQTRFPIHNAVHCACLALPGCAEAQAVGSACRRAEAQNLRITSQWASNARR